MELSRKFETTLLDEETITKHQEERAESCIGVLDVDGLRREIDNWTRKKDQVRPALIDGGERRRQSAQASLETAIGNNYDTFLKIDSEAGFLNSMIMWQTIFSSRHPFLRKIREDVEQADPPYQSKTLERQKRIREAIKDRSMPIDAWLAILDEYEAKLLGYNEDLQERVPEMRKYIATRFISRINPELENPKTEAELADVLGSVNVRIKDPLLSYKNIGTHTSQDATIDLDLMTLRSELIERKDFSPKALNLIAHEELHALSSGQVVNHKLSFSDSNGEEIKTDDSFEAEQSEWHGLLVSGLRFSRFSWLNEAVTETLSSKLVDTEPLSYPKEREFLDLFLKKGKRQVDMRLLTNAYFERRGYQASDDENKHKFWKQFRQEVREAYDHDPQFLVKIDILIQKKGIDKAIELLKKWDPEQPTDINSWIAQEDVKE